MNSTIDIAAKDCVGIKPNNWKEWHKKK